MQFEVQLAADDEWGKDDEASIQLPPNAELFKVDVMEDLHPTQLSVGMQQVCLPICVCVCACACACARATVCLVLGAEGWAA